MITLKNEENQPYRKQNVCHICKKEFGIDDGIKKNITKSAIIVIILESVEGLLIIFVNLDKKHQNKFL